MPECPADLLAAALRADPAGPLLTWYDDATGERVELSAATLDNWVAKTANLLQDEIGVQPGDRVGVSLPPHWQTAVALLACWSAGVDVRPGSLEEPVVLVCEAQLTEVLGMTNPPGDIVAFSLAPLGRGLAAPRAGVVDYAGQVLAHGDRFLPYEPVTPDLPALDGEPGGALVERARARSAALGIGTGDRLLIAPDLFAQPVDGVVDLLLAPLAAGASVVLCGHADPAALARRAREERVTVTLATPVDGVRQAGPLG